jgi:hypothetical protein
VDRKRIEELKKATKLAVAAASRQQRMGTQPFGPARAATVAVPATVIGASPLEADEANETDENVHFTAWWMLLRGGWYIDVH